MSRMKSRLVVASVLCVAIHGCKSTGVGNPLPSGGSATFLLYAPPNAMVALKIIEIGGHPLEFVRDPIYDNDPVRPAGIPSTYVAFTTLHHLDGGVTYHGELLQWSPWINDWVYADAVKPWPANDLILIEED